MPMRKRTLRRMPPETRRLAKLVGELESMVTRLKNLIPEVQSLEMMARAEAKRQALVQKGQPKSEVNPLFGEDSP